MKKISSIIIASAVFLPQFVLADSILGRMKNAGSGAYNTEVGNSGILDYAGLVISVILGFLGIIFLGLVINAGYTWMMAGGDAAKIGKAKDELWRAVIGLLIIVGAYAIQAYVFGKLVYGQ